MVAILSALLLFCLAAASPLPKGSSPGGPPSSGSSYSSVCARQATGSTIKVNTPLGPATGSVSNGVARFTVKYGSAQRFEPATIPPSWTMLNDASAMPPVCLQAANGNSGGPIGVEDCLYMVLYVPLSNSVISSGLPVLTWVHGGSFIEGSASNPGLDGSSLAKATNSVVAVVQYRLGVFGFIPPSAATSNSNLGAKDVVLALQFLNKVVTSLGGNKSLVTIAGQSSGASLIRGLLASPSASAYFQKAWLHSDPMTYGFAAPSALSNLQDAMYSSLSCATTNLACQQALSTGDIISAQNNVFNQAGAGSIDITVVGGEPFRIVHDGTFVTTTLTGSDLPSTLKPIITTTTNADAGPAIYDMDPPEPGSSWNDLLEQSFGPDGTQAIIDSNFYPTPPSDDPDVRPQLVTLGTDQIWRCPTWTLARAWAAAGGVAYVGVFVEGSVYPDSANLAICTETNVCHEGDIEIVFGSVPSPTAKQAALTKEIQARYSGFIHTSQPNAATFATWQPATTNSVNALNLGGSGVAADGGCEVGFFGDQVPYFYELFGQ